MEKQFKLPHPSEIQLNKSTWCVPQNKYLDDSIPFAEELELIVEIDIDPQGTTDDYIDDLISLTLDVEGTDNIVRCNRAPLLAFD
jgi:hypothetical protein